MFLEADGLFLSIGQYDTCLLYKVLAFVAGAVPGGIFECHVLVARLSYVDMQQFVVIMYQKRGHHTDDAAKHLAFAL